MASKPTFTTDLSGTKITLGNYYTSVGSYTNIYVFNKVKDFKSETYPKLIPILSLANMDSNKKPHTVNIKYLNITYQLLKILDPFYKQDDEDDEDHEDDEDDDKYADKIYKKINITFDELINKEEFIPIIKDKIFNEKLKTKLLEIIKNFSNIINGYSEIFKDSEINKNLKTASFKKQDNYKFTETNYKSLLESYIEFLNNWINILKVMEEPNGSKVSGVFGERGKASEAKLKSNSDPKDFSSLSENISKITTQLNAISPDKKPNETVANSPLNPTATI